MMDRSKSPSKPFEISKLEVWESYQQVRANKGAPGVDGQSIEAFESELKDNLYRLWNRMSSGTYFPPAVKAVEIPKGASGVRVLGVPTVTDRIAQTVVARQLAVRAEPRFHPDSYGYRPGRSAVDAVVVCRQRCWKADWVLRLDIESFFDSVDHDLMVKAVEANTDAAWVVLYVKRWLVAPMATAEGALVARDRGTPQGSAVSPILANLFLHYALDAWLLREFPAITFERYADDAVVHCVSRGQALLVLRAITRRFVSVGLRLHPDKTRIIYCQDGRRTGSHPGTSFEFLGFEFRARSARSRNGKRFLSFLPAVSKAALKQMSAQVRAWRLHRWTHLSLSDLARWVVPTVRGWMNYYGRFYRSKLYQLLIRINSYLVRWARSKYRRLRSFKRSIAWWRALVDRASNLFPHWAWARQFVW